MIKRNQDALNTPPAHHGAFDYEELARLGLSDDEIIDFSVNSNPYGPPPAVREAILHVPLDRYPDRDCLALRQTLALPKMPGMRLENIVVGNGTAELLHLIAFAVLNQGDSVLVVEPTFSEYARVARLMGATVAELRLLPDRSPSYGDIAAEIKRTNARVVFMCHPNNPTGLPLDVQRVGGLIETFQDVLFVVDEAYLHFTPNLMSIYDHNYGYANLIVLRSMTKDYALAGLRLGYALGHPTLIEAVQRVRPPWNVNALAQAAGIAALNSGPWLHDTMAQLQEDKHGLIDGMRELGLRPLASATHYFLVNVGDGMAFRSKLLAHRIMVRDCASFGLPEYVRIATRTPQDNQHLLDAIRKTLV